MSGNTATQAVTFGKEAVEKSQWLGYDNNGNLVSVTSATSVALYSWDAENRLTNITVNGVTVLECWYDGHGRRLAKREVVDGQTNVFQYVYDGWTVLAVLNLEGKLLEYYTRGSGLAGDIGTIVAETKLSGGAATNTYYYHCNHRGDVTAVRSTNGTTFATWDYRPFGEVRSSTGNFNPRYRFSSKEFDQTVDLYYYGYRFYSPLLGRWFSRDPLSALNGLDLYNPLNNNPLNVVDPDGQAAIALPIIGRIIVDVIGKAIVGSCVIVAGSLVCNRTDTACSDARPNEQVCNRIAQWAEPKKDALGNAILNCLYVCTDGSTVHTQMPDVGIGCSRWTYAPISGPPMQGWK